MVLGSICDTECFVHFHKYTVTIYDPQGLPLLQGWQENTGAKLWRFSLCPQSSNTYSTEEYEKEFTVIPKSGVKFSNLQAFSAYDLPSVEALVRYFHTDTGFPVKSMWMGTIKDGNFAS